MKWVKTTSEDGNKGWVNLENAFTIHFMSEDNLTKITSVENPEHCVYVKETPGEIFELLEKF
jgi:hypothetical protein